MSCAVCRTRVKKVFGSSKRWHFALFPGAVSCDHENETVAHRETKLALFEALEENLHSGWSVFVEKNLPNGRRPDVLATHEDGVRVAFEVQYADLPEMTWRERREAYRVSGIKDYWLLGHSRRKLAHDALASILAGEEGQRTIYVGRWQDAPESQGITAREALFRVPESSGLLPPGAAASPSDRAERGAEYELRKISLSTDGSLTTPANKLHERLERERLESERRARAREEARRKAEETEFKRAEEKRRWAAEKKIQENNVWRDSRERTKALSLLGEKRLLLLEEEGVLDRNIYAHPGRWKSEIFLSCVHGRQPGTVFDWFTVAGGILRRHAHNKHQGASWAWKALWSFLEGLEREGLVEFHERDGRGNPRYWRTTSEETLAKRREEKKRRRTEEQRRTEERAVLEAKWERNRLERLERERWEAVSRGAWSVSEEETARKAQISRAKRALSWLSSPERANTRMILGERLMTLLEQEAPEDWGVLTHPGEWKSFAYLLFVHGEAIGTLDEGSIAQEVRGMFPEAPGGRIGDSTPIDAAVRNWLDTLRAEGLLHKIGPGHYKIHGPGDTSGVFP